MINRPATGKIENATIHRISKHARRQSGGQIPLQASKGAEESGTGWPGPVGGQRRSSPGVKTNHQSTASPQERKEEHEVQAVAGGGPGLVDDLGLGSPQTSASDDSVQAMDDLQHLQRLPPLIQLPSRPYASIGRVFDQDVSRKAAKTETLIETGNSETQQSKTRASVANEATKQMWTGSGIEDDLSETVIQEGYASSALVTNELGTARSSVGPHLQDREKLQDLSQLFLLAIRQQKSSSHVSSTTSFKPPPRVTLTDAKKMTWFSDLANSLVPLHKLSRTIPHGVRGKVLLEQCLSHEIPISRAMWLVKCVGLNELRARRRKGVSNALVVENERKWVQEWTSEVSSFLFDGVLKFADNTQTIFYVLQLASGIYAENLVDAFQFLENLITKYEEIRLEENLVLLFSIVQIWIEPLLKYLQLALRLIKTSVHKLQMLQEMDLPETLQPLFQRIIGTLELVLEREPSTYLGFTVMPLLLPSHLDEEMPEHLVRSIRERIQTIQRSVIDITNQTLDPVSSRRDTGSTLIVHLDRAKVQQDINYVVHLAEDFASIVQAIVIVIRWATSVWRATRGDSVLAVCVLERLCKSWKAGRAAILDAIDECVVDVATSKTRMEQLVNLLTQRGMLDAKTYINRLITSGIPKTEQAMTDGEAALSAVLENIPAASISRQLCAMRNQLLARLGHKHHQPHDEETKLGQLRTSLPTLFPQSVTKALNRNQHSFPDFSAPEDRSVAALLIDALKQYQQVVYKSAFTPSETKTLYTIFEDELNNPSALIPALPLIIRNTQHSVIWLIARLCKDYEKILSITGRLPQIRNTLISRYRILRQQHPSDKAFAQCMLTFDGIPPSAEAYLQDEIRQYESGQALAAFTPASDTVINDSQIIFDEYEGSIGSSGLEEANGLPAVSLASLSARVCACETISEDVLLNVLNMLESLLTRSSHSKYGLLIAETTPAESVFSILDILLVLVKQLPKHLLEKIKNLCTTARLREMLVSGIINHEQAIRGGFKALLGRDFMKPQRAILKQVFLNLIDPAGSMSTQTTTHNLSVLSQPSQADVDIGRFVIDVLQAADRLNSNVLGHGLQYIIDIGRHEEAFKVEVIEVKILETLSAAIRDNSENWKLMLQDLSQSLGILPRTLKAVEEALLSNYSHDGGNASGHLVGVPNAQLLEIIKLAQPHRPSHGDRISCNSFVIDMMQTACFSTDNLDPCGVEASILIIRNHRDCLTTEASQKAIVSVLCRVIVGSCCSDLAFSVASSFIADWERPVFTSLWSTLPHEVQSSSNVQFLLGCEISNSGLALSTKSQVERDQQTNKSLSSFNLHAEDPTQPLPVLQSFDARPWEMLQDSSFRHGENDTPLGLRLFDAHKS